MRHFSCRLCLTPLILFLLSGCYGGGDLNHYAEEKPRVLDLAGIYRPDARTLDLIRDTGHYPQQSIEIRLEKNGKVRLYNIPDWAAGENHGKSVTGYGSWTLNTKENEWAGEGKLRWVVALDVAMLARDVDLREHKPPYVLQMIVGDPDAMTAMHFEKQTQ